MEKIIYFNRIKWLDKLKVGDKVKYSNGINSWIEKFKYYILPNGFWFKGYCTAHGDTFDYNGKSKIGNETVSLICDKDNIY